MAFHEGKACDAVIRVLEAREGESRRDVRSPEKDGNPAPIELTCRIGDRLFAFEHTGIEPFAGHVKFEAEAHGISIRSGTCSPANYRRAMSSNFTCRRWRRRENASVNSSRYRSPWPNGSSDRADDNGRALCLLPQIRSESQPQGCRSTFPCTASCRPLQCPVTSDQAQVSGNLEEAREDRLREACARKFPKLEAWRQNSSARTVLTLEDNDLQLTNPQRVFDVLAQVEDTIAGKPDEIHLVGTLIDNPWYVHALRIDNHTYYRLSEFRLCMTEIDFERSC